MSRDVALQVSGGNERGKPGEHARGARARVRQRLQRRRRRLGVVAHPKRQLAGTTSMLSIYKLRALRDSDHEGRLTRTRFNC